MDQFMLHKIGWIRLIVAVAWRCSCCIQAWFHFMRGGWYHVEERKRLRPLVFRPHNQGSPFTLLFRWSLTCCWHRGRTFSWNADTYNGTGNDPFVDFLGEWALLALKSTNRSLPVSLCTGLADDDFLEEIQHCRKEAEIGSPLKTLKVSTIFWGSTILEVVSVKPGDTGHGFRYVHSTTLHSYSSFVDLPGPHRLSNFPSTH